MRSSKRIEGAQSTKSLLDALQPAIWQAELTRLHGVASALPFRVVPQLLSDTLEHHELGRPAKTLRVTPAMQAGVSDHVWTLEQIATLAG